MEKFLVLYRSSKSAEEQMRGATPEQAKAGMDAWMAWGKKHGGSIVDMGAPLGSSTFVAGKAVQDHVGGFSLVQAESLDAAKKIFEAHPHTQAPGASIEILKFLSMPS